MCTYGDIVEPVSRTAWEDWDENGVVQNNSELKWLMTSDPLEKIDTLLIFEGKYLSDCIKMESQNKLDLVNSISEVNLNLYKINMSNTYICIIKDYNLVMSSEIVELLKNYILTSKDVISIQAKSLPNYQSMEQHTQDCVIRMVLTTKPHLRSFKFPKLEQPNIISGVSAGVISLREHLDLPGAAVIYYTEHGEECQIEEMDKLLKNLNIIQKVGNRPSSVLNSNLYI